ncbi:MAG: hypothetical protein HUN05_18970 [Desulfobacter sp.]|nr:MAG: hypothetical protein HUN05_18970 [Desulfobacter sp.]
MIIYVVDAHGKQEKSFSPFIDGCFNGPDGVFHLLKGYLNSLHIQNSDKILFVADGAHWIWNRIPGLLKALGLAPERVYELLDFYHAVEHLGKVAGLRKTWSSKERKHWVSKQRGLLLKGKAIEVVQAVQKLCRGRNSKAIKTERDYFVRNELRLNFSTVKALNLPIGSGAIESSIRRVGECSEFCVTVSVPGSASAPAEVKVRSENGPSISHVGGVDFCWSGVPGTIFSICK